MITSDGSLARFRQARLLLFHWLLATHSLIAKSTIEIRVASRIESADQNLAVSEDRYEINGCVLCLVSLLTDVAEC